MMRGHDHPENGWAIFEKYKKKPVLTICSMCYSDRVSSPVPCIARWVYGKLPEVHQIPVPEDIIRELYPESTDQPASSVDLNDAQRKVKGI
jgi:hypothetical protein